MTTTTYTPDEITERLRNAGAASFNTTRAAHYLLMFCNIASMPALAGNLRFGEVYAGPDGETLVPAAWVTSWEKLRKDLGVHMHGGMECLLNVAEALEGRKEINLEKWMPAAGGHAHARALMQAMAIATGYDEWYEITPTSRLTEHDSWLRDLEAGN